MEGVVLEKDELEYQDMFQLEALPANQDFDSNAEKLHDI